MTELTAQVSSSGEVIVSEMFAVPNSTKYVVKIKPKVTLVSKLNVVIYYITENGEIISDSVSVEYGKELRNKVSLIL